jgi:hypothetical protein
MIRQPIVITWDAPSVTFAGAVSGQAQSGEQVTITVKKPDHTTDTVTAATDASRAYSMPYSGAPGTGYNAVARIGADARYQAAASARVTFNLPVATFKVGPASWWPGLISWLPWRKRARTITLKVA